MSEERYKGAMVYDEPLTILFTDSTGVNRERSVIPQRVWFGCTEWYPQEQWLLDAYDTERHVVRSFSLAAIHGFEGHTDLRVPHGSADHCAAG
ncbi:hypothetical protein GUY44_09130 [Pimelobacter simplex]|uniref:hypothetical protein n=1 Tax=Nocardioides simplex TaxID=2045 RepID=UPI0008DF338D|nr:hypothetical protein [Pimelobacter simplex]MCG8150641.1 hypothetical protein [Pimelobacter simplex]SFM85629.1 hypothetical protein SAMN05421671_3776 [Pimelobacter simplex]